MITTTIITSPMAALGLDHRHGCAIHGLRRFGQSRNGRSGRRGRRPGGRGFSGETLKKGPPGRVDLLRILLVKRIEFFDEPRVDPEIKLRRLHWEAPEITRDVPLRQRSFFRKWRTRKVERPPP